MKWRGFTGRERPVVYAVGLVLALVVLNAVVMGPKRDRLRWLASRTAALAKEYGRVLEAQREIDQINLQLQEVRARIGRRPKDFDLQKRVSELEAKHGFQSRVMKVQEPKALVGRYEKMQLSCMYENRTLKQIKDFLYDLERPEDDVNVEVMQLIPSKDGTVFTANLVLSFIREKP